MQRWLLQSKRTQAWDTPLNSVNAVYAFLDGNADALTENAERPTVLKLNGQKLSMPKATAGLGYVKTSKTGDNFKSLTAEKSSTGISWGAVYAQFMQPTVDVADASMGMTVVRQVLKDGKKLSSDDVQLQVGDRITVRLTITADRDYDFVQLSDRRAACLEPVEHYPATAMAITASPRTTPQTISSTVLPRASTWWRLRIMSTVQDNTPRAHVLWLVPMRLSLWLAQRR